MKTLGDVIKLETGEQLNKSDMLPNAEHPVVNGGIDFSGYTDKYNSEANTITISQGGASAGYVNWLDQRFWAGAHCYVVMPLPDNDVRFLYHFIKSREYNFMKNQQGAGIPSLNRSEVYKTAFPDFDYSKQKEIAEILDSFTSMISNLETELASRQKQYEHYRNKLLTFDENDESVEWKTLAEIVSKDCSISYGIVQPGDGIANGVPVVRPVDLVNTIVHNIKLKRTTEEISNAYKRTILKGGELLLCVRGTTGILSIAGDDLCGCNVTRGIVPLWFGEGILRSYAYHIIKSTRIQDEIERNTNGAGLRQINIKDLKVIKIPVPNMECQQEIVSTLDTFESLISNIKQELEARKKQYEYYREQLLTFRPSPALP